MKNTKNTPKAATHVSLRRDAFKFRDAATKADRTKFEKGMQCAHTLRKLEALRTAGQIVLAGDDSKKVTQKQFVTWLNEGRGKGNRIELAMFKRYLRAASFTAHEVEAYLEEVGTKNGTHDKGASVTGLVNFYKESKETDETLSTLTAGESRLTCKGDAKNRTYSFKGELSALEAEATKLLAAIARLKKDGANA